MRDEGAGSHVLIVALGLGLLGGAAYLLTRKVTAEPSQAASPPKPLGLPLPQAFTQAASSIVLDRGLTREESIAVLYALVHEKTPGNLLAFAAVLEPDHPLAVERLRARAISLGTVVSGEPCCESCKNGASPCAGSSI